MPEFWVPPSDPDSLLIITGLGGFQYQARGLHQTLEVIASANQCERTVNGVLVDVSNPLFRKYASKITCTDVAAPPLDNLFPGMTVSIQFAGELAYPTGNPGSPARIAVDGSTRTPDGGNYTFYRPVLTMLVRNLNYSFDEWGSDYGWELTWKKFDKGGHNMATATQCSQASAQAALDALLAKLNAISGHDGVIKIFTGSAPADCEASDTGTLLSTMTLSATAFGASSTSASPRGAQATANAIASDTNAAATGTAGYFRAYSFDGATYTCVIQGDCGTSGTDMILNTTSIVAGATVSCSSWTVTLPDGG